MRTYRRKLLITAGVALVYFLVSINIEGFYELRTKGRCNNSLMEMRDLKELVLETHYILTSLEITHFLAYGSLWGALRYNGIIPWDYDFDFGILQEDVQRVDFNRLKHEFADKEIKIEYNSYGGFYKVRKRMASGDLMIFSEYYNDGVMRRTGFESWIFFIQYRWYHQFPARLIKKPLPLHSFVGTDLPVPREGNEIQKYFYPNNWWIETVPKGCNRNSSIVSVLNTK